MRYISTEAHFEETLRTKIGSLSTVLPFRETMHTIALFKSSQLGVGGEAIARGFDLAGVMSDLVSTNPGTEVVDVGRDLHNPEAMNLFLNTADFTSFRRHSHGEVAEERISCVCSHRSEEPGRALVGTDFTSGYTALYVA